MLSLPRPLRALVAAGLLLALTLPLAGGPRASAATVAAPAAPRVPAAAPVSEKTPPPGLTAHDWTQLQAQLANAEQDGRLEAADPAVLDFFGWSIAVSGELVVVGAPFDDDGGDRAGAAYIYARNQGGPGNWGQVKKLTAGDAQVEGEFGHSVAISGDIVVVGAWYADGGPGDPKSDAGAVYVFERNLGGADNWGQRKKLAASDAAIGDNLGTSVAISGDVIVSGAEFKNSFTGAAYVFVRSQGGANNWGQAQKLSPSDAAADDVFGASVGLSGNLIVVGASNDDDSGDDAGSAYIFERSPGTNTWVEVTKLLDSNGDDDDNFGRHVGLSGDVVVVGVGSKDDVGDGAGAAFIYARNQGGANAWGLVKKIHASDAQAGDAFGEAVAVNGDLVVVGAFNEAGGAGDPVLGAGAVYIFERNHGGADNWGESGVFRDASAVDFDFLGGSVAVGGSGLIAAGATRADAIQPNPDVLQGGAAFLACQDDGLEENDFANTASALPEGRLSGLQICSGNPDVFQFAASAGDWVSVTLEFAHADGDLDVFMYGSDLQQIAASVSINDHEIIVYPITATDTYYLQVIGYEGALNRYSLSLTTAPLFIPLMRR